MSFCFTLLLPRTPIRSTLLQLNSYSPPNFNSAAIPAHREGFMLVPKRLITLIGATFLLSTLPAMATPATKLVFNPINPCRMIDTRIAGQPLTGILVAGSPRTFFVAASDYTTQGGNPAGCGMPGFVDDGSGNLSTVVKAIALNL